MKNWFIYSAITAIIWLTCYRLDLLDMRITRVILSMLTLPFYLLAVVGAMALFEMIFSLLEFKRYEKEN